MSIAVESVWGRRGLLKLNSLWLPLTVMLTGGACAPGRLALLAFAVVCWIFVSTLTNNFVERDDDAASGKSRWIAALPAAQAASVVLTFFAVGWASLAAARVPVAAHAAYLAATLLGLAYSIRPSRLKEKGAWGLFAYSFSCAVCYVFLPWAALNGVWAALVFLALSVFLDKWVNLHFHQVIDHDADLKRGVRTYAVLAGLVNARRSLRRFAWASAAASAAAVLYAASLLPARRPAVLALAAGGSLAGALIRLGSRKYPGLRTALLRELPWAYLGLTMAAFRLVPLALVWGSWPAFAVISLFVAAEARLSLRYRYE